jgi:murein L,D-transpeptidase YcbB/YkuD
MDKRLPVLALLLCAAVVSAQPLWLGPAGRPNEAAREALALLAAARDDGLEPGDYRAAALAVDAARLDAAGGHLPQTQLATFEAALGAAVLRFMRDLHAGRQAPRAAGFALPAHATHDFDTLLRAALSARRLTAAVAELRPSFAQYASLRAALARYRSLAAGGDEPPPRWPATLRPGDTTAGLDALRRRLVALGDLDAGAPVVDAARYDGALVDAVRRFQRRHALAADGAIGRLTQAALAVPPAQRVLQIELALERLRWLPRLDERRFVAVNIPMFRLWALRPGEPALGMKVIVGRAFDTRTPVLAAELTQVVFRPYWNVPRSIVRNELLGPIARDPSYLARHDLEIVRGDGDDAHAVPPIPAHLALLRAGALRLRQRPGPRNALGLVKFVFPNAADVYLHATPAQQLFEPVRRDFSHGCVRVEQPVLLAEWVLRDEPAAWPRERIERAIQGGRTQVVKLARPLTVLLYYVTALVLPDGELHFAEDLYRHDERLARALAAR